jgi:predicted nucleic acid-binding protein
MTSMTGDTFFDTNVLVYQFDQASPRKAEVAQGLVQALDPVISTQVLSEFYVTVTRKGERPLTSAQAAEAVAHLREFRVVEQTASLIAAAIETSIRHQLSYWDALIIESAGASGCSRLLTEDLAHGATICGVYIDNPFRGV